MKISNAEWKPKISRNIYMCFDYYNYTYVYKCKISINFIRKIFCWKYKGNTFCYYLLFLDYVSIFYIKLCQFSISFFFIFTVTIFFVFTFSMPFVLIWSNIGRNPHFLPPTKIWDIYCFVRDDQVNLFVHFRISRFVFITEKTKIYRNGSYYFSFLLHAFMSYRSAFLPIHKNNLT